MDPPIPTSPALTLRPEPLRWAEMLGEFTLTESAARFRRQLDLPTDRPIILSGHQPWIWHAGILAKWLALGAAAHAADAAPVWLSVDHDAVDPWEIRYPVRTADGRLRGAVWRLDAQPRDPTPDLPAFLRPPLVSISTPPALVDGQTYAEPRTPKAFDAIRSALSAANGAPSAAAQIDGALRTLIRRLVPGCPPDPQSLCSSRLSATDLFATLVERMRSDPVSAARAYNVAAAEHPAARIQPLSIAGAHAELPVWKVIGDGPGAARARVNSTELDRFPPDRLLPRALFMTALLRLGGCELFIHGTGGAGDPGPLTALGDRGGYDAVTDRWISAWLGRVSLAPVVLATATVRLPLDAGADASTPESIARAAWTAHHARHDPALLGDHAAGARTRDLVGRIAALRGQPNRAAERGSLYRELHALLAEVRTTHAGTIERFAAHAADARAQLEGARVAADRTWSFPLHATGGEGADGEGVLTMLAADARRAFIPAQVPPAPARRPPRR